MLLLTHVCSRPLLWEPKSEVPVGGHVALGGDARFDPLACLAQDSKGVYLALG